MPRKLLISAMIVILSASFSIAGSLMENYYPTFKSCLDKLGHEFTIDDNAYEVKMDYKALLNFMEGLDMTTIKIVGSMAIEWDRGVEFPSLKQLSTKEGKLQLAKAIQTAQARAILRAAESIVTKDKVWL